MLPLVVGEGSGFSILYSYLITQFFPLSFMLDIMLLFEPQIVAMYKESIYSLKCIQQKYDSDHTFYNVTTTKKQFWYGNVCCGWFCCLEWRNITIFKAKVR